MSLVDAVAADQGQRLEEAALRYEEVLTSDPLNVTAIVNLIVLYWQVTEYGFWKSRNLPRDFVSCAGDRLQELIRQVPARLRSEPAIEFWRHYIAWTDLGEDFSVEQAKSMMRTGTGQRYVEPAMYVFSVTEGVECENEAREVLSSSREVGTTRARYVESVIEATLQRTQNDKGGA